MSYSHTEEPVRSINETQHGKNDRRDEWKLTNVTWQKMQVFGDRIDEVIDGHEKFVIAYGPPGIAKTSIVNLKLRAYYERLKSAWEATDPDMRNPRHTIYESFGVATFRPPFFPVPGRCTAIQLFKHLHDYSDAGNILALDDLTEDKQKQQLVHQASDLEQNCLVTWDTSRDIMEIDGDGNRKYWPTRFNFHGSLIVVNNLKHGSEELEKKYSQQLRSRSSPVFFTWDRSDILTYIDKLAFAGGGLFKYMQAPDRGPEDSRGLGFTGTKEEAVPILRDVRNYFLTNSGKITTLDFRLLRGLTKDRVRYGWDGWERRAQEHLV